MVYSSFLFLLQRHSIGAEVLERSTNVTNQRNDSAKVWHCPACTYENPLASVICEICSSPRGLANNMKTLNNLNNFSSSGGVEPNDASEWNRQESKLMENLRKIEETEARNKWENIKLYCEDVRIYLFLYIYYYHILSYINNF